MRRFAVIALLAGVLAGCGGEDEAREPTATAASKAKAKATRTAEPPADGVDTIAERVMEEVPGCTPDEAVRVRSWKRAGVVAIRTGICEDKVLDAVTVFEFRSEKAARESEDDHGLIDHPDAENGPVVATGNVRCHEESMRRKDWVTCMLRVRKYILLAHGKPGRGTAAIADRRMAALARAAE